MGLPRDADGRILFEQLGDADEGAMRDTAVNIMPEREQTETIQLDCETQTPTRALLNVAVQSRTYCEAEIQANTKLSELTTEEYERNLFDRGTGVSMQLLYDIGDALEQNAASQAFVAHTVEWEASQTKVRRVHTLRAHARDASGGHPNPPVAGTAGDTGDARRAVEKRAGNGAEEGQGGGGGGGGVAVAAVSWNCTGNMLAVCYGRMDIQGTDTSSSCVAVWNLSRVFLRPDTPDHVLEAPSSVMSVAFHPTHPAIIIGGTFSGELLAWNLGNPEDKLAIPVLKGERAHREAVIALEWVTDPIHQDFKVVSCSSDGNVVVWKLKDMDMDSLWPIAAYEMKPDDDEKNKAKYAGLELAHKSQRRKALGLTSLAFEKFVGGREVEGDDSSGRGTSGLVETGTYLVGTETGGVFKCFLNYAVLYDKVPKEVRFSAVSAPDVPFSKFKCPINYSYSPHYGPVHGVAYSKLLRHVFASCGADGTIRIHNANQQTAHLTLEPTLSYTFSIAWSPSKPLVLAVGSGAGRILIYNLATDAAKPVETLYLTAGSNVGALAFSHDGASLAAGDWAGVSSVWTLSKGLSEPSPSDAADVRNFGITNRSA